MVQELVAKGEIQMALGPDSSDMKNPGVDVVGPFAAGRSTLRRYYGVPFHNCARQESSHGALGEFLSSRDSEVRSGRQRRYFPLH